jgi:uncharacterized protein YciI
VSRLYLSPKGLADVRKRVSPEDRARLDQLVTDGQIVIVGGKQSEKPDTIDLTAHEGKDEGTHP